MNPRLHKIYIGSFFLIGISLAVLIAADGLSYYSTPLEERFFHGDHNALKPSGSFGHGYGIAGSMMMIAGVSVYMIRKRYRRFFNLGYLKHWLEFHIFLCTTGPLLVLYHTAFKFGGIVAVSFWSMVAVVLSGFAGRFIYIQIPRNIQGKEIDIKELEEENSELQNSLRAKYSIDQGIFDRVSNFTSREKYRGLTLWTTIIFVLKDYFSLKNFTAGLKKQLISAEVPTARRKEIISVVKKQVILSRRIGVLRTMQRLFKFWHIVHLPFAITMFVIMFIHIIVTIVFGYKWIF